MVKSIFDINDTLPEPKFTIQAKENYEGEDEGLKAIREHEDCTDIGDLKTLKDFDFDEVGMRQVLRQEAIKQVKELNDYGDLGIEYAQNKEEEMLCKFKPAVEWIKYFFNLEEKDVQ